MLKSLTSEDIQKFRVWYYNRLRHIPQGFLGNWVYFEMLYVLDMITSRMLKKRGWRAPSIK